MPGPVASCHVGYCSVPTGVCFGFGVGVTHGAYEVEIVRERVREETPHLLRVDRREADVLVTTIGEVVLRVRDEVVERFGQVIRRPDLVVVRADLRLVVGPPVTLRVVEVVVDVATLRPERELEVVLRARRRRRVDHEEIVVEPIGLIRRAVGARPVAVHSGLGTREDAREQVERDGRAHRERTVVAVVEEVRRRLRRVAVEHGAERERLRDHSGWCRGSALARARSPRRS